MAPSIYRSHPWHGIELGDSAPDLINAFIEILPTDVIKYEVHKPSGHIFVDRPLRYSSQCPTLYGFVPQTYAAENVAKISGDAINQSIKGDGDPIDICVLTERPITRGAVLMQVKLIGGIRLIDKGEADDKLIAVLHNDAVYGNYNDINDCPELLVDRLQHYFLTYKDLPSQNGSSGNEKSKNVYIAGVYGADIAKQVVMAGYKDYANHYAETLSEFKKAYH
jgi:inorganic pyrophosphatase